MLPCYACQHSDAERKNKGFFRWKGENLPPLYEKDPSHIDLLEQYNIPFIFDIHTHFFPEYIMRLIWKWFDKVQWDIAYRFSTEKRLEELKKNRVSYFTSLNYAHRPNMAEMLNLWVYENCLQIPGMLAFRTFYPENGVLRYTKKAVEEYGLKGFKLHCEVSKLNLNLPELHSVFLYLEEKQIPLVIHTGTAPLKGEFTGISYFAPFMQTFPRLKVIVAHMGAAEIEEYANLFAIYPNLYMDTTMVFVDFLATGESVDEVFFSWKNTVNVFSLALIFRIFPIPIVMQ